MQCGLVCIWKYGCKHQKVIFGKVEIEEKNFNFNKNKKKMKHCPVVKDVSFKTLKLSLEL